MENNSIVIEKVIPGKFSDLFTKDNLKHSWFVGWRFFLFSSLLAILLSFIFNKTLPAHFIITNLIHIVAAIFILNIIAKSFIKKHYEIQTNKFIGCAITWRTIVVWVAAMGFIFIFGAIMAILIPFFAKFGKLSWYFIVLPLYTLGVLFSVSIMFTMFGRIVNVIILRTIKSINSETTELNTI